MEIFSTIVVTGKDHCDKLFHGSPAHGRIEVYDVVGDFEIVKNKKFIKIAYGHNSLTMGPRYFPKKGK